ncbi:MAG TPA: hypothetical protein VE175_08125, partial [Woeseiaceae bacterium]|nr:hypothetical protein [Woeseiaceae bacterium]
SGIAWFVIRATIGIRVSEEHEYEGVDLSECGLEAYPEFTTADGGAPHSAHAAVAMGLREEAVMRSSPAGRV